ncbi:MAG: host-nuclease inhibitor Gam family protein [Desulfovibrionaceae bacterium]|nr:host-nuclease inhibitor Gam family protein [Desulfovibrionaceae bacterium]MBF0513664.1 host-nuclease inhibitor Gam family protein [Desulfovibrionaceae bacterium]
MARFKPEKGVVITDLAGADAALAELAALKREQEAVKADANARIDAIKAEAKLKVAPIDARIKELEAAMAAFGVTRKEEVFKKRRSMPLVFGKIGFHKSVELKPMPKTTWEMVLEKIKELKIVGVIRIKESIDKEALKKLSDERLEQIGVRKVPKDDFYYETKVQAVSEQAA